MVGELKSNRLHQYLAQMVALEIGLFDSSRALETRWR